MEVNSRAILSCFDLKPEKKLGQNFLQDDQVRELFVQTADLTPTDKVLEIGPGLGSLTVAIAQKAEKVVAIEKDRRLIPLLKSNLKEFGVLDQTIMISGDILDIDWDLIHGRMFNFQKFKILGAVPYSITSPLLHSLVRQADKVEKIVLIIQEEVAQKITAKPPQGSYLGNYLQSFFSVELVGEKIKPGSFSPSPKVFSRIIALSPRDDLVIPLSESRRWQGFLHRGFQSPRKMLNKVFAPQELLDCGIDPEARPQTLSLSQWLDLFGQKKTPV